MVAHYDQDNQNASLMALDQYLHSVRWTPQLVLEEEVALIERVEIGKAERSQACSDVRVIENANQARDRLVAGYQPLVLYIARKYAHRTRSMDLLDLVQEGNLGLLRAVELNDMSKGYSLAGIAGRCIRDNILEALYYRDRLVRLSARTERALGQMNHLEWQLTAALGHSPSVREMAEAMQVSEEKVQELVMSAEAGQVESLHFILDGDEEEERHNLVPLFVASEEDDVRVAEVVPLVHQAIEVVLSAKEREVVSRRYGLGGECQLLKEVAAEMGMWAANVQRVERRAKKRLHAALAPVYLNEQEEGVA